MPQASIDPRRWPEKAGSLCFPAGNFQITRPLCDNHSDMPGQIPRMNIFGRALWAWATFLVFSFGSQAGAIAGTSQTQSQGQEAPSQVPDDSGSEEDPEAADSKEATKDDKDSGEDESERSTRSGYEEPTHGGPTSVESDLHSDDQFKRPVFRLLQTSIQPLYNFKDRINGLWGIAFGVDYNFLNQYASFSFTEDQATSGSLRFFGTWDFLHSKEKLDGRFVFRIENRHTIGGGITPRDLGFDAGSALSTASFKDFAWGITALHWKQFFADRKYAFAFGQMDPGDFMDAFPLLSAWTAFMSNAFNNNPGEALPNQGVGFATRLYMTDHYYVSGGVHDALGDADGLNFAQLFDGEDLFYWA
ncbi:MAG: hypothetical protein WBG93_13470, partial [Thermoanaerobaculia bacterium]